MKKIYKYESFDKFSLNESEGIELFIEPENLGDELNDYELNVNVDSDTDIVEIVIKDGEKRFILEYFLENDDEVINGEEEPEIVYLMGFEEGNDTDNESYVIDEDSNLYKEVLNIIISKLKTDYD